MSKVQISLSQIASVYSACNADYIQRKGDDAKINSKGMQIDIAAGLSLFSKFTDAQFDVLNSFNVDFLPNIKKDINVKVLKRLPSFLLFAIAGDVRDLTASAKTCAIEVCAILYGAKNRDALRFSATGRGDENTSDIIDTAKARKLMSIIGKISPGSESTHNSVSFASGNIGDVLNIAHKTGRSALPVINEQSPLVSRIVRRIEELTDSQISELAPKNSDIVKPLKASRKAKATK